MIETKECNSCNKISTTKGENNFTYCPYCGKLYEKVYSINMCDCNDNVMSSEPCTKCYKNPTKMSEENFHEYYEGLCIKYNREKKIMDKTRGRIDKMYGFTSNIHCKNCSKYEICDSCRGKYCE
jgi:hypothetical protein